MCVWYLVGSDGIQCPLTLRSKSISNYPLEYKMKQRIISISLRSSDIHQILTPCSLLFCEFLLLLSSCEREKESSHHMFDALLLSLRFSLGFRLIWMKSNSRLTMNAHKHYTHLIIVIRLHFRWRGWLLSCLRSIEKYVCRHFDFRWVLAYV